MVEFQLSLELSSLLSLCYPVLSGVCQSILKSIYMSINRSQTVTTEHQKDRDLMWPLHSLHAQNQVNINFTANIRGQSSPVPCIPMEEVTSILFYAKAIQEGPFLYMADDNSSFNLTLAEKWDGI